MAKVTHFDTALGRVLLSIPYTARARSKVMTHHLVGICVLQ